MFHQREERTGDLTACFIRDIHLPVLNIASALRNHRWAARRSLRDFGKELGISAATLMRLEQGYETDARTMVKLVKWLFSENDEEAKRAPSHAQRKTQKLHPRAY